MAKKITKAQVKKIWTMRHTLGIPEKGLRDIVECVSYQRSTRALTKSQGKRLIDALEGKTSRPSLNFPQRGKTLCPRKDEKVIGGFAKLVTPEQLSLIENLKKEAGWDNERLTNFIRKIFTKDTLDKLGGNEAGVVITVLKRAKKKLVTEV
ncbi:MAG: DUF1018 domain-containing protein [Candidatus Jettenia sp. CY-1]|nr:DUF1018 domain-containing protein [Candidatus Jettenia sp.]WKZ17522.1 MAG: DUF1018 domain-containing protein [Candidatus Jettenia sp. CY-1]